MAVVSRVLLDHVEDDPSQTGRSTKEAQQGSGLVGCEGRFRALLPVQVGQFTRCNERRQRS